MEINRIRESDEEVEKDRSQFKRMKKRNMTTEEETRWALFSFGYDSDEAYWFVFPVHVDDSLLKPIIDHPSDNDGKPAVFTSSEASRPYSCTVLSSLLYIAGGYSSPSKSLKIYDLSALSRGERVVERNGPDMLCARCGAAVLPLNGKLYVFHGFLISSSSEEHHQQEHLWAEIYDPGCTESSKWRPLHPPPKHYEFFPDLSLFSRKPPYDSFWAVMDTSILFGSYRYKDHLVIYTMKEGDGGAIEWIVTVLSLPETRTILGPFETTWGLPQSFGQARAVPIGRTLLWFDPTSGLFVAFDMNRKVWFGEKEQGFCDPIVFYISELFPHLALLHEGIGGEQSIVCLLFPQPFMWPDVSLLHCVSMKIRIDPDAEEIVSQTICHQCMKANALHYNHHFLS